MKRKRILLTGDDGYNSVGTRLVARALRDQYDLQIAATLHQQSGVGGGLSLKSGGKWGEDEVDGIPALWADGTPADVMECAQGFFSEPFDYLISGMNLGPNASTAVISSGTYAAAIRGMGLQLAPQAIALHWDAPAEVWLQDHSARDDLSQYLEYPGDTLRPIIDLAFENNFWGVQLLNINLPQQPTKKVRFTKMLKDITKYFAYPISIHREEKTFSYQESELFQIQEENLRYDVAAIEAGYISITPCAFEMTHFTTFQELEKIELSL